MSDFVYEGKDSTGERRILALFADAAGSRAAQLGILYPHSVCGCESSEFSVICAQASTERALRNGDIVSESPEDFIARVEVVEFCFRLLKNVSPAESRALLDYFAGDMEAFSRHTGICDKGGTDNYVATLLEKLAGIIRERNLQPSEFY